MLELPVKFKSALGNGVRTSLFPVIRFYKDVRIYDPEGNQEPFIPWSEAESVNLSIKETNLDGITFDPLLLNTPNIRSSADVINNKYTISSVSLSISNAPYKGKIFSDDVQSLLNAVCQVYYCANGLNSLDDCLLVYTGTVRRFNQSAESIKLELEDVTEQMLSTQIPASLIPDEINYKKDNIGEPFPMVYGYVDKSPLIAKSIGADEETGEIAEQIAELYIDKRGKLTGGEWTYPNQLDYVNDFITENHDLVQNGWLSLDGYLSVYNNGFLPMAQKMPERWGYEDEIFEDIDIYTFQQSNGTDTSASINISSEIITITGDVSGIPTRVYRPIKELQCFTYCDSNQEDDESDSVNRIWGFTGYFNTEEWEPWRFSETISGRTGYENNWDTGDLSWWEPTACNVNTNGGALSSIDINWIANNRGGKFPVDRLQNGSISDGIYVGGRNADGTRDSGHNKSGGAYVRMIFEDNVGSFPCATRVVFDSHCHSFAGMDDGARRPYGALFWTENGLPVARGLPDSDDEKIEHLLDSDTDFRFPTIPNIDQPWEHITGGTIHSDQDGTESTVLLYNGSGFATSFNNTTAFNSIQFGVPQYPKRDTTTGNDDGYVSAQLFNCYTLQDAVVDEPINQDFYADVKGRLDEHNNIITSSQNIMEDILKDELNYNGSITLGGFSDWQHSFTLNEQKEAKGVFEGLFKSSLSIPSFDAQGQFKFLDLKQIIEDSNAQALVHNEDIIKYSFELSKIDDVKNQVNV